MDMDMRSHAQASFLRHHKATSSLLRRLLPFSPSIPIAIDVTPPRNHKTTEREGKSLSFFIALPSIPNSSGFYASHHLHLSSSTLFLILPCFPIQSSSIFLYLCPSFSLSLFCLVSFLWQSQASGIRGTNFAIFKYGSLLHQALQPFVREKGDAYPHGWPRCRR